MVYWFQQELEMEGGVVIFCYSISINYYLLLFIKVIQTKVRKNSSQDYLYKNRRQRNGWFCFSLLTTIN